MNRENSTLLSGTKQHTTYESLNPKVRSPPLPSRSRPRTVVASLKDFSARNHRSESPMSIQIAHRRPSEESSSVNVDYEVKWTEKLPYYLPCYSWIPTYDLDKFLGDFVAGLSLASFQIPLALSYATSVAHVPALCGLYALAIPPIIYAVFGSVPQMIVGPESAISLVVGEAVSPLLAHDGTLDPVDLVSVMSCIGGFYLLGAGLCRFGFLDNVLSRSLLRGFISAVGLVMIINSLFDELGLRVVSRDIPTHFYSPYEKFVYLFTHLKYVHTATSLISLGSFLSLFTMGKLKKIFIAKGYNGFVFIPEIMIVVIISIILSGHNDWKSLGVEIVGSIKTENFSYNNPFTSKMLPLYHSLMSGSFLAATLGFFESTTASKSLGSIYNLPISSNRELVALGAINIFGGIIGALPAFGGYGRSRINAMSGAKTTFSGFIMGCFTLITIFFLLQHIYYLPKAILSVVTTTVGIKLLEEAPSDVMFHWRARGYSELVTFCITVAVSLLYSMEAGIAVGVGYSIIRVIKNSSNSGIQILGRLPGTNTFLNADEPLPEEDGDLLEEVEGCLIIKIAEPLTFSNTSDLKLRLLRLERYGSSKVHPGAPRLRNEYMNQHVLFDMNGLTYFDSSAAQILYEILEGYQQKGIKFYFIRVPTKHGIRDRLTNSGITELSGNHFYSHIEEVLKIIDRGADSVSPQLSIQIDSGPLSA